MHACPMAFLKKHKEEENVENLCPFNFRLKCHLIMMAFGYTINERKIGHLNKRGCKLRSEKM